MPPPPFQLPDTIVALPVRPFEFRAAASEEASALLARPPVDLFHGLVKDQESETVLLASRRILEAFAPAARRGMVDRDPLPQDAAGIAEYLIGARQELKGTLDRLADAGPHVGEQVLRQRAPLALIDGCWLDMVSQPATQPAVCVNRLVGQQWVLRGRGNPHRSLHRLRRLRLEQAGIYLPDVSAPDFLRQAASRPLTALQACFYVALSRLPANFLPEVVGVHFAFHTIGVDDLLLGGPPSLDATSLTSALDEYLALAGEEVRRRLRAAIRLTLSLESEHVDMLAEQAKWSEGLDLNSKVAAIIARHAPMAGRQHGEVRVAGRLLADTFGDAEFDMQEFMHSFRQSAFVRPSAGGTAPWIQAMKFGGPMFGIFDERESSICKEWVGRLDRGDLPEGPISVDHSGDRAAERWARAIADSSPADVRLVDAEVGDTGDNRRLFHRLVNIENFANTLPLARQRAEDLFGRAEILFTHGAEGRYTDASWFEYSPEALMERGKSIYWEKLVDPYQPITEVPDRDEVIFTQCTYALGSLIDGAWIHRIANLGHRSRASDEMLYHIYADEMGFGDLRKNHLTLIYRVLASLELELPHIRDEAFMDQRDLPDELYPSSLHQLCMCLHPDTFYNEILGYNFAIEMFGSGEFRLHEGQKLRHYGFDDCYEVAHLAIDNFSSGHTRQAADIIVSYLDDVRRTVGEGAVAAEWRRIWRGYASFAYFVEQDLIKQIASRPEPEEEAGAMVDLIL